MANATGNDFRISANGVLRVEKARERGSRQNLEWQAARKIRGRLYHNFEDGHKEGRQLESQRRVQGFTIFVDGVSRRISKSVLWRTFECYGKIADVYLATNNAKRKHQGYTFAFVRYVVEVNMWKAIEEANGRLMDGFKIQVSKAKYDRKEIRNKSNGVSIRIDRSQSSRGNKVEGRSPMMGKDSKVDGRSFKNVLMNVEGGNGYGNSERDKMEEDEKIREDNYGGIKYQDRWRDEENSYGKGVGGKKGEFMVGVPKTVTRWSQNCMVGRILGAYSVSVIRQVAVLERIPISVSKWDEERIIIQFQNQEERERIIRDEWQFFAKWFEGLEKYEGGKHRRSYKTWISLFNVPLMTWDIEFFRSIASRWGRFIQLDDATNNKSDFQVARMLIEVECPEAIPRALSVSFRGELWKIGVSLMDRVSWTEVNSGQAKFPVEKDSDWEEEWIDSFEEEDGLGNATAGGMLLHNEVLEDESLNILGEGKTTQCGVQEEGGNDTWGRELDNQDEKHASAMGTGFSEGGRIKWKQVGVK